MKHRRIYKDN